MLKFKKILGPTLLIGAALSMLPALAFAQSFTVGTVNGSTSGTSVSVPWTLQSGGGLQGANFEIEYDPAIFTPNLSDCTSGVVGITSSCTLESVGGRDFISIGLLNFAGAIEANQSGSITFAYASGVAAANYPLTVTEVVDNTVPEGTDITIVSGAIVLQDLAPALTLNPTSLTFSAETGTTSPSQSVTATNSGNQDGLIFEDFIFGSAGFAETSNCPESTPGLAQGASCTINITFSPTSVGDFSTTFTVSTNANDGEVAITATGTAGPAPDLAIAPATQDFGELLTNDETATTSFTVTNSGPSRSSASIDTISGLSGALSVSGGSCEAGTTSLASGQSCTISVTFAPTADGAVSQTLTVDGTDTLNEGSVSTSATVEGTGVSEARFSSNPAPGNVNLGFAGAAGQLDQDVVVTNSGNVDLNLTECAITGDPDEVFTIAPLNITVAAGETGTFNAACDLPDLATYSATLTCATNDTDNAEVSWTFSCSGLEPLPVPTMSNWSIAFFALLMLLVGGFSIRFFRV